MEFRLDDPAALGTGKRGGAMQLNLERPALLVMQTLTPVEVPEQERLRCPPII